MKCDYLIVGSGLCGATIARLLADAGHRVLILERRKYLGGNVADEQHTSGIHVGLHGPHYFRTSSEQIWQFVNRFAEFHPHAAIIKSHVNGQLENWPIAASYIRKIAGENWRPQFVGKAENFEQAALSMMPREIYQRFVKGYTEKQWGVPAESLSAQLCKRFDVRADDNPYLTPHAKFQGVPTEGYSIMMQRMLAGIPIELGVNFLADRDAIKPRRMTIYSGPIDEYFNFSLGKLQYRGQQRRTNFLPQPDWVQPCGQVNYPNLNDGPWIRTIEWKHMMRADLAATIRGTVLTTETPHSPNNPDEYEYPFPNEMNDKLYRKYQNMAQRESNALFCGRLAEYRYYDMDQAIGRAMMLAGRILSDTLAEAA